MIHRPTKAIAAAENALELSFTDEGKFRSYIAISQSYRAKNRHTEALKHSTKASELADRMMYVGDKPNLGGGVKRLAIAYNEMALANLQLKQVSHAA